MRKYFHMQNMLQKNDVVHISQLTEVLKQYSPSLRRLTLLLTLKAIGNAHINTVDVTFYQWDCDILIWQSVFSPGIICEIENSSISLHFTVHDQTVVTLHNHSIKLRWNTETIVRYAVHWFHESTLIMEAIQLS